ncbi:MAG: TerB N-terminal domain-containing protein [Deltaproteobacteria bacterium]|nr:TerB N-terminal domain-containing protein [Deltaproteobacteria bacterium]
MWLVIFIIIILCVAIIFYIKQDTNLFSDREVKKVFQKEVQLVDRNEHDRVRAEGIQRDRENREQLKAKETLKRQHNKKIQLDSEQMKREHRQKEARTLKKRERKKRDKIIREFLDSHEREQRDKKSKILKIDQSLEEILKRLEDEREQLLSDRENGLFQLSDITGKDEQPKKMEDGLKRKLTESEITVCKRLDHHEREYHEQGQCELGNRISGQHALQKELLYRNIIALLQQIKELALLKQRIEYQDQEYEKLNRENENPTHSLKNQKASQLDTNGQHAVSYKWIPFDGFLQHAGYSIYGGLVYFGRGLKSVNGWSEEPSMIDPDLPVDKSNPDRKGENMWYNPSYSRIHPTSRAAFLEWLAYGKKDPYANIGYVFLYFYGLERRALADISYSTIAQNEISIITTEVKRLLSIYGANHSFNKYATKFLNALQASQSNTLFYISEPRVQPCPFEIPLTLKIALGQMARDDIPLSAEWALAWAENDPNMPLGTPVQRCITEFRKLFKIRYIEKYGEGFKIKSNKLKTLFSYNPASASFGGQVELKVSDLPDVTADTGLSSKIIEIINTCTDDLTSFSRYLARNPFDKDSFEAVTYLPKLLLIKHNGAEFQKFLNWLYSKIPSDLPVLIQLSSLLKHFKSFDLEYLGKNEITVIANFFRKINIGIEPDPNFCNFIPKIGQDIILFRISDNAPTSPSTQYSAATTMFLLASVVANANGHVDESKKKYLQNFLETLLYLTPDEKIRLEAYNYWLLTYFPNLNGIKKRIELLKKDQLEFLGCFLVGVAQADGYIDPSEMKILTKIYELLGLEKQSLYSQAHIASVEPVSVQTIDFLKQQTFSTLIQPKLKNNFDGILLDMNNVEKKMAETLAVSEILNNIFSEQEAVPTKKSIFENTSSVKIIAGLDTESFRFMQILASKQIWTKEELNNLASDHSLMLEGTLDSINDASFDHFGGAFFEGVDPIEINPEYAKEIIECTPQSARKTGM